EVGTAAERLARYAADGADARQRDVDQAIQEFVHAGAAQGDLAADRPSVANLERGHGLAGKRGQRLLAGDLGHVGNGVFQHLLVAHGFAHAHVQRDLGDAGDLHRVVVTELLDQLRHDLLFVDLFQARHGLLLTGPPLRRWSGTYEPGARLRAAWIRRVRPCPWRG